METIFKIFACFFSIGHKRNDKYNVNYINYKLYQTKKSFLLEVNHIY